MVIPPQLPPAAGTEAECRETCSVRGTCSGYQFEQMDRGNRDYSRCGLHSTVISGMTFTEGAVCLAKKASLARIYPISMPPVDDQAASLARTVSPVPVFAPPTGRSSGIVEGSVGRTCDVGGPVGKDQAVELQTGVGQDEVDCQQLCGSLDWCRGFQFEVMGRSITRQGVSGICLLFQVAILGVTHTTVGSAVCYVKVDLQDV